VVSNSERIVTQ